MTSPRVLPQVRLVLLSDPRQNIVEVDGHDITKAVAAVQVGRVAGEPFSHVTLHLRADVELDTDLAEVVIEKPGPATPAAALRELLDEVDPGELEQAALDKISGLDGGPATTGQAFLAVLKEWMDS